MSEVNRLPRPFGTLIDRDQPITFTHDQRSYCGFAGDTIASALAASGTWIISHSNKYGRPRGILTLSGHDGNTAVRLPLCPEVLADREAIHDGLSSSSLSGQPPASAGKKRWFGRLSPAAARQPLSGLDPDYQPGDPLEQRRFAQLVVIGGGGAGLLAALEAANEGVEVLIIEQGPELGGSLGYARGSVDATWERKERAQLLAALRGVRTVEVMTNTAVIGWYDDNLLELNGATGSMLLRAGKIMVCTGSHEQPAIFRNNDLPGIMLGTAAQRLIKLYGVRPGRVAVVLAGNDHAYGVALDLIDARVQIAAVVDMRPVSSTDERAQQVRQQGIGVYQGHTIYQAIGDQHVQSVEIREITGAGQCATEGQRLDCDLVCMSVGFMPAWRLVGQAGAKLNYNEEQAQFWIEKAPRNVELRGSVAGDGTFGRNFAWPMYQHPQGQEFVDLDGDLTIADILSAINEGFDHIDLLQRQTGCGSGPSQGRQSDLAIARLTAYQTDRSVAEAGLIQASPPAAPQTLSQSSGRSFEPVGHSPLHQQHLAAGGCMVLDNGWLTPAFFGQRADGQIRIVQEVRAVRSSVGLIDLSMMGGLEIIGDDAEQLVANACVGHGNDIPSGRAQQLYLLDESGFVANECVAWRLSRRHYYLTTPAGTNGHAYRHLLKWNAGWRLNVRLLDVTNAWCAIGLAGPESARVLASLLDGGASHLPLKLMSTASGRVAGIPVRLLRHGDLGELCFEIHAPQSLTPRLWSLLADAGKEADIRAVGARAHRLLRLEMGLLAIGRDTDNLTTLRELGVDPGALPEAFFVGQRSTRILYKLVQQRALAGFEITHAISRMPAAGNGVIEQDEVIGQVIACERSPTLDKTIGLAFLPPHAVKPGLTVTIEADSGAMIAAKVVNLPFYQSSATGSITSEWINRLATDAESATIKPDSTSLLDHWHRANGGFFEEETQPGLVTHYQPEGEDEQALHLGLCDLSPLPRAGLVGAGAADWLHDNGHLTPGRVNQAQLQSSGDLIAQLAADEFLGLALSALERGNQAHFDWRNALSESVFDSGRQEGHSWFALTGMQAPELLSMVCSVDLRYAKCASGTVLQTLVAGATTIIIRHGFGPTTGFSLLPEASASVYLWDLLADLMPRLDGRPVGVAALR